MPKHRGRRMDFWSKVAVGDMDECWPWIGSMGNEGYGQVRVEKRLMRAHRRAYELIYGPLPDEIRVRHFVCDYPRCCNFLHLLKGTDLDNVIDCIRHGRLTQGKLTEDQVREIRRLWETKESTQTAIAQVFGVSRRMIGLVVRRRAWAWVS